MISSLRICFVLMITAALFQGCAADPAKKSTEELIADGEQFYSAGKYERAVEALKRARERYPAPDVAAKIEIGIADAYFMNKEYIEAAAEYEGFRKLYPRHQQAGYALYRQAMSNYRQIKGIDTDQTPVSNARTLFDSYLLQFPSGEHKQEVQDKNRDSKDKQLQYEIYVGRFYLKTGKPLAASGRFEHALKLFPEKLRHDELLFWLGKSRIEADQKDKGREALERLVKEFPDSSYASEAAQLLAKGL